MAQEPVSVYEGENITVTYDRRRCIHAAECGRSGSPVFDVTKDPWIDPSLADVEAIVRVIHRCPTAALTYVRKDGGPQEPAPEHNTVTVSPDGPLYVRGQVQILRPDGSEISREYRVALCRCGASKHKPFCDNSHIEAGFKDLGPVNADPDPAQTLEAGPLKITVRKDGPLHVQGSVTVYAGNGREAMRATELWLCRCGGSQNKPFCDGTHKKIGFRPDSGEGG